ncbi:MAG: hypothetical protein N4A33_10345 [Bacteriovoracaceae bacterium]|jgi:hypothetical protein|nr:hypothetical protein [Bacteriovoracaceae bacterium]
MKLLLVVMSLVAFSASAVSLQFKFDVNSSGPSIYPCDAGLKHARHNERVCYDRVTKESCNPGTCVDDNDCNCVCTGGYNSDAGEYRHDFLQAGHADWTDNGEYAGTIANTKKIAGVNGYNRVFTANNEWNKQLTSLSFNFGSERYGAEFFLDVCYRGPQIEYFYAGQFAGSANNSPNFALKAQATITDLSSTIKTYEELSGLVVKAQAVCDVQGKGSYMYAGTGNPATGTTYNDALAHQINGDVVTGNQFLASSNFGAFNFGQNLFLLQEWINLGNSNTPRFCKIRYTFLENRRNDNDLLTQLRKWKHQKAQICTYTEINEAE